MSIWIVKGENKGEDRRHRARVEFYCGEILVISEAEDGNETIELELDPYHARILAVEIIAALAQADKLREEVT